MPAETKTETKPATPSATAKPKPSAEQVLALAAEKFAADKSHDGVKLPPVAKAVVESIIDFIL